MSLIDYEKYLIANLHKDAKEKDSERQLLATIMNFGGMGVSEPISAEKLVPIALYDVNDVTLPIKTDKQAMEVFWFVLNS